jgi:uncharacterized BrkB/YihY/UPF0761 family membrane protein
MVQIAKTLWRATVKFIDDGGSAIASNVALSLLLSLFPFLMLVTSLVRIWGSPALVDEVFNLVLEHWPADSEKAITDQIKIMVAQRPNEFFSIGTFVALVLATNGIENARDGLNRAYRVTETAHSGGGACKARCSLLSEHSGLSWPLSFLSRRRLCGRSWSTSLPGWNRFLLLWVPPSMHLPLVC